MLPFVSLYVSRVVKIFYPKATSTGYSIALIELVVKL